METRIAEIAPRVYRLSTFVPGVALKPKTLAIMHGSSFNGDCVAALNGLGDFYADRMPAQLKA